MKDLDCERTRTTAKALEEGEALLAKPGVRHHKSMRKFVMKHAKLQEGFTWFHVVFCNDEGYSPAQLDIIDISARVLTWSAVTEARDLGLDVGEREVDFEPRADKEPLVMEAAWMLLSPETCTNDEVRKLVALVVLLLQKLHGFLTNRSALFVDCPDYQIRGLEIPREAKPWVVIAEDKRTGRPIWEYCTDHADAKARRALMRSHAYRFSKFEIMSPRALSDHDAEMREIFSPTSTAPKSAWPFP